MNKSSFLCECGFRTDQSPCEHCGRYIEDRIEKDEIIKTIKRHIKGIEKAVEKLEI